MTRTNLERRLAVLQKRKQTLIQAGKNGSVYDNAINETLKQIQNV